MAQGPFLNPYGIGAQVFQMEVFCVCRRYHSLSERTPDFPSLKPVLGQTLPVANLYSNSWLPLPTCTVNWSSEKSLMLWQLGILGRRFEREKLVIESGAAARQRRHARRRPRTGERERLISISS